MQLTDHMITFFAPWKMDMVGHHIRILWLSQVSLSMPCDLSTVEGNDAMPMPFPMWSCPVMPFFLDFNAATDTWVGQNEANGISELDYRTLGIFERTINHESL